MKSHARLLAATLCAVALPVTSAVAWTRDVSCMSDADCQSDEYCAWPLEAAQDDPDQLVVEGECLPLDSLPPPPPECQSNADCEAGTHCEFFDIVSACEPIECEDEVCPQIACVDSVVTTGACVDDGLQPGDCLSDADCGPSEYCQFEEGWFESCEDLDPGPTYGVCQAIVGEEPECYQDSDCADGFRCDLGVYPLERGPNDDVAHIVMEGGTCVYAGSDSECVVDEDCGPGAHCEHLGAICDVVIYIDDDGNETIEDGCEEPGWSGICVADFIPENECATDEQCGENEVCVIPMVHMADPGCDDAESCLGAPRAPTIGQCQPIGFDTEDELTCVLRLNDDCLVREGDEITLSCDASSSAASPTWLLSLLLAGLVRRRRQG